MCSRSLVEGTAQTTDVEVTISNMTLCAGGMRSSFDLAISRLKANGTDATSLGLAIGFEFGPMSVTRLGMKSGLIRCSVSRGVIAAERNRRVAKAPKPRLVKSPEDGTDAVRAIFGDTRKRDRLDYDTAVNAMSSKNDKTARAAKALTGSPLLKPATAAAAPLAFPNRPAGPAKPGGFA